MSRRSGRILVETRSSFQNEEGECEIGAQSRNLGEWEIKPHIKLVAGWL